MLCCQRLGGIGIYLGMGGRQEDGKAEGQKAISDQGYAVATIRLHPTILADQSEETLKNGLIFLKPAAGDFFGLYHGGATAEDRALNLARNGALVSLILKERKATVL